MFHKTWMCMHQIKSQRVLIISLVIMKSCLIFRSMWQRMTIIGLMTGASMRHLINVGRGVSLRKWAFNDAPDSSESEGEEITITKHLRFPTFDSCFPLSPSPSPPISSCWKICLRFSVPSTCFLHSIFMSFGPCVKNKGHPAGYGVAEGLRDAWLWYFHWQPKCLALEPI